ncbi:glycosyltransferase family 2 protein [Xenorhabdus griffiniae]|uniref:glycosyltransferase family 2 protein n=1 Tax=Xenorhabdus griffiniae TaxID=351672 RepID=UPI0023598AD7|nr:glycosyltransferase family 2 protein [Xenorhabdus griffiniae]MDC9603962.1 glycosyltransferase family 2 protein [Xenorhabdus griffiniae]
MNKVSLVTVLFNCSEVLPDFFSGLAKQDYTDYHLYIIDNSTNNDSIDEARLLINKFNLIDKTTLIKNENNLGIAKANNQGIQLSLDNGSHYTLLLNNDIIWKSNNVISTMVNYSCLNNVDIIVPKILYHDTHKIWCAGGGFIKYKGVTFHRGENEIDNGQYDHIEETEYSPTCFMLINNQVFRDVGLMDERFFVYYDDTDFVWRATSKGKKLFYFGQVTICHKVSSSTGGKLSPFSVYQISRNKIWFTRKNYSLPMFFVSLLYLILTLPLCFTRIKNPILRKRLLAGIIDGFFNMPKHQKNLQ